MLDPPQSAKSGWSFGVLQFDLSAGGDDATPGSDTFENILTYADGAGLNKTGISVGRIIDAAESRGSLTPAELKFIQSALGSAYGQSQLNTLYDNTYNTYIKGILQVQGSVTGAAASFLNQLPAMLFIADVLNQGVGSVATLASLPCVTNR